MEYVKKYEKMAQFSVLVEGRDVGVSKTVFSGSNAKGENAIGNGTSKVTNVTFKVMPS